MLDILASSPKFFAFLFFALSVITNYKACVCFHHSKYGKFVGFLALTFAASLLMFAAVGSGMQP